MSVKSEVVGRLLAEYPEYSAAKVRTLSQQLYAVQDSSMADSMKRKIQKALEDYHLLSAQVEAASGVVGGAKNG